MPSSLGAQAGWISNCDIESTTPSVDSLMSGGGATPAGDCSRKEQTDIHLGPSDGRERLERHTAVSEEDFKREPHRNRFNVLIGRTAQLAYHFGQVKLSGTL